MLRQRQPPPPSSKPVRDRNAATTGRESDIGEKRGNVMAATDGQDDDPRHPLLGVGRGVAKIVVDAEGNANKALSERHPVSSGVTTQEGEEEDMENLSRKSQWIVLALASGGCAAFNGVFAKLTTTELTTNFATWIANLIGLGKVEGGVEVVARGLFFALNLVFNGIMWTLFTKALARGTSTTQVSILNTSANFMITAILGFIIFSESLPPLWFVGAALLVAGNVIIGRREEGEGKSADDGDEHVRAENGEGNYSGAEEGEGLLIGEELEFQDELEIERKRKEEEEDLVALGLDDEETEGSRSPRLI